MPIHIEEINAKRLGPLDEFSAKLKNINLIFGLNEHGKTFLVEFIIRSLFKNTKGFNLRDAGSTGMVQVSGLGDEMQTFSPKSSMKLEDYWEESSPGMPTNAAQLLVVKGAELNFEGSRTGRVSKSMISSFLSSEKTLDAVAGKIQATVQGASIGEGVINGNNAGKLKARNEKLAQLKQLETLLERVDVEYSGGTLAALRSTETGLLENTAQQNDARRYLAHTRSQEIEQVQQEIRKMDAGDFPELAEKHADYRRKVDELGRKEDDLAEKVQASEHYDWLTSAIETYESYLNQGATPVKRSNFVLAAVFSISAFVLIFLGLLLNVLNAAVMDELFTIGAGISITLGVIFGYLDFRQRKKNESMVAKSNEIERMEAAYQDKFGEPATDIASFKSKHKHLESDYYDAQSIEKEISETETEIRVLDSQIKNGFQKLDLPGEDETQWGEVIAGLQDALKQNESQLHELQLDLANLNVAADDYLENDPGTAYDPALLKKYEADLDDLQQQIEEEEKNFASLKDEIRGAVQDKPAADWDDLLEKLRQKYQQLVDEYKGITAEILAGILVTQVIQEVRLQEDEKIKKILAANAVQRPLYLITKKYRRASLDGDLLRVSDKFDNFDIADLSTGAREQILLALRIGFAARVMGKEAGFLILDDAFQHSDWTRREYSIKTIIELAKSNWQIIYFSMDNHIRDLFNSRVEPEFGEDFLYRELVPVIGS